MGLSRHHCLLAEAYAKSAKIWRMFERVRHVSQPDKPYPLFFFHCLGYVLQQRAEARTAYVAGEEMDDM